MNEDREFQEREANIPSQMGNLIATFMKDVSDGEWQNRVHYGETMQLLVAAKNVDYYVAIGVLTMEQKLTLEASIPFLEYVVKSYFGAKKATLDLEFRVSAKRNDSDNLKAGVHTKTGGQIGGGIAGALFGGGGNFSVAADTTYSKETRRQSDYSSTCKVHIEMGIVDPPESVSFMSQATQEIVKAGVTVNKTIIEKQKEQLVSDVDSADVPKDLHAKEGGDSDTGAESGSTQSATQEAGE